MTPGDAPAPGLARLAKQLGVAVVALILVAGMFLTAYLHASAAADKAKTASDDAKATVACVNRLLGSRASTTEADAKAHIAFAKAVDGLFLPATATPTERERAVTLFRIAVTTYVRTLVADQQYRDTHPLGLC